MIFRQESLDSIAKAETSLSDAMPETKCLQDERLNTFVESIKVTKH